MVEQIIARLEPLVTERRAARMQQVLATRSDHVAFVFEHMVDPHNLSAVLRTLEALSFQDAWLIGPAERVQLARRVTQGSEQWLTVHAREDTAECFADLRARGYRVVASHVAPGRSRPLNALDAGRRLALVFGNEHAGVSAEGVAQADDLFHIPMLGFVESFNLSVAAAICAHHLRGEMERRRAADACPERFALCARRRRELYAAWLCHSVRNAERVLAEAGLALPAAAGT
ncbi:MAG: RNA methyltransferase [Candidatus Lambdaproteobacteria bacterium]|nr:RNA methyltransferase [Candidatus Lambdaproteobacteria bacterium]